MHCVVISDIFRQIELQFTIWFFSEKIIWRNFRKKKYNYNLQKLPSGEAPDPVANALSLTSLAEPYATFISVLGETPEIADLHVTFSANM